MHAPETDAIACIEARIIALQQAHLALQEQLTQATQQAERQLNDAAMRVIDVLDLLDSVQSKRAMNEEAPPEVSSLIFKKIEKRLLEILRRWQVEEINVTEGRLDVGKMRVLDTRPSVDEAAVGKIMEICRKGYQRGNKTIRPADV